MRLLTIFSKNVSYGLPVGGPAARLLSELLLNRVDRLLLSQGITFCRFADDYHIFSQSAEESYRRLVFLSEKLLENEGLLVQKGKTRILSSDEFLSTSEFSDLNKPEDPAETATREFLRLKIHYDPYSPTGDEDYELLKAELARFDVVGMLAREIRKSRVHQTLTRKLVTAIQHVDRDQKSGAAESLIESLEELHPVVPAVMMTLKAVLPDIEEAARKSILEKLRRLFTGGSLVLAVPAHLAFSVRVLAEDDSQEADEILARIYHETSSASIKRDVILAMARRGADFWISDIKNKFATLTPWESGRNCSLLHASW